MKSLRAARAACVLLLALSPACSRSKPEEAPPSSATPPAAAPSAEASALGAADAALPGADAAAPVEPPAGYEAMTVMDVVETSHGSAVLLVDGAGESVLPIFIGGTEALSIALRLEGQRHARPLTHDLLDALVARLGGDLVKVHVDELRGTTFVGSVFVRQEARLIEADARPSDAIALALGRRTPIFVAKKVITAAGLKKRDIEASPDGVLNLPGRPTEPFSL